MESNAGRPEQLSWSDAMALFKPDDADMIRRNAVRKHAGVIVVQSHNKVNAVLYGKALTVDNPTCFLPNSGFVIGYTSVIQ